MNIVRFSILSYSPSFMINELINIGILFECKNELHFVYTKNYKRLQNFDDELNIDFVKKYLKGIKEELKRELNLYDNYNNLTIDKYIKDFVNEFKFSGVKKIESDNF